MKKILLILLILLLSILALLIFISFNKTNKFKVIFFDIGQGDSALIKFIDGSKMLVDCGPDKKVLAKLGKYLPFYDRTIDYLLVTHFDLDHYGGCLDVLKRYKVKNIIINSSQKSKDKYWLAWQQFKQQEQAQEIILTQTTTWQIASSTLEFLSPSQNYNLPADDSNNNSIVFRLIHASTTILFTADMEEKLENILLEKYCLSKIQTCSALQAKILKVGHHGSNSSSGVKFLVAVNPQLAIVSVGQNKFGHPSLRILTRLRRQGVKILRTDQMSDIIRN